MEVISNLEVDVDFYRLAHLDLQHLTDEQLVEHYIIYGKNEGRTPNNVDVDFYRNNHPDLQHLTDKQLVHHYIEYGKKEGRLPNKQVDDDSIRCVKICMIYVYYERQHEQKNQTNLAFFIKYGLDKSRWRDMDITTLFVINGHQCEVLIPEATNIFVVKEDNCSDWEGWYNGIKYFENKYNTPIYNSFTHLCLINASCFGPIYEDGKDKHWLDPFLNKMEEEQSVICCPCANILPDTDLGGPGKRIVPTCSLLKINLTIYNLLINTQVYSFLNKTAGGWYNTILGSKIHKVDAVLTGEYALSQILIDNNYKISSLVISTDEYRIDFYNLDNSNLKDTIFIKNTWRWEENYASQPVLYDYCINFANNKLNYTNELQAYDVNYDVLKHKYKSEGTMIIPYFLPIKTGETTYWNSLTDLYNKFLYPEEIIVFPKHNINNSNCVIYAHYDKDNIIKDYVINSLKILQILGYDIIFYTACTFVPNIDKKLLPFKINYVINNGAGTDWCMWLSGLQNFCDNYERILLINDSLILGINGIENMRNTINNMRNKDVDLWGHWDSTEINYHYVGTPLEIKQCLRMDLILFLETTIPKCKHVNDFINKLEVRLIEHVRSLGYKTDVVLKQSDILGEQEISLFGCPSHNPFLLHRWMHLDCSFAVKWKYVLTYLRFNNIKHPFLNYLIRYLHTNEEYLFTSTGETNGVFVRQHDFKQLNWYNTGIENYP